ncbi:MAG: hypothetical protein ACYS47_14245 [Planctomycetota bacterium]
MEGRKFFTVFLSIAALACFFISPAFGQEGLGEIKEEIAKLQRELEKAKKAGDWDEFVRIQRRITGLYREMEERLRGREKREKEREGEGEKDDLGEWLEKVEAEIRGMGREKQIDFLEGIVTRLKERGEHRKARAVAKMLESILHGRREGGELEKKLHELERHIEELRHAAAKAERDFDFEKADGFKAKLKKLEKEKKKLLKKMKGGKEKVRKGEGRERELAELYGAYKRARDEGDRERMKEIARRISELKRGGKRPAKEKGQEWRSACLGVLEETIGRLKKWVDHHAREGDHGMVEELEEGIVKLKDLWEAIERARGEEGRIHVLQQIHKAIEDLRKEIPRFKEEGMGDRAEMAQWVVERFHKMRDVIVKGMDRELAPWRRNALGVMEAMSKRIKKWLHNAREEGEEGMVEELENMQNGMKKFGDALRIAHEEQIREQIMPQLEEGIEKLRDEMEEVREAGHGDKAEMMGVLLDHMRKVQGILREGTHGGGRREVGGGRDRAVQILEHVMERMRGWARHYDEEGEREAVEELKEGMAGVEELREIVKRARGPEPMEKALRELGEAIRDLEERIHAAREERQEDKVEILLWIAGQFREAYEVLRHAPRPERGRREGRGEGRPEFGRQLRELAMELRRAMEEGDEERVAELRERIQELRRHAAERRGPPRERPRRGERAEGGERGERERPERDERARGETERLRREINDLRKELESLKKLLKRLLGEKEKD